MRTPAWIAGLVLVVCCCAGCGGNSSNTGSVPPTNTSPTSPTAPQASIAVNVDWPDRGRAVPNGTSSVKIVVWNDAFLQTQTIDRPAVGSAYTANFYQVPVGQLTVNATAYTQTAGNGVVLATSSDVITTQQNTMAILTLAMAGNAGNIASLTIGNQSTALLVGGKLALQVTPKDSAGNILLVGGQQIAWQSNDTAVATVDDSGAVTGISAGTATITATAVETGVTANVTVTVNNPVTTKTGLIYYLSDSGGGRDIYVMNPDGSNVRRLTYYYEWEDELNVTRDSTMMAYISDRADGRFHLFVSNTDGTNVQQVTSGSTDEWCPCISNDKTQIYCCRTLNSGNDNLFVKGLNEEMPGTRLTTNTTMDVLPMPTPDGKKIIFCSNRTGTYNLYSMNPDGTEQTRLVVDDADQNWYEDVSPDGKMIAYTKGDKYMEYEAIYVVNIDGSNPHPVTFFNNYADVRPTFSPDGKTLAFASDRDPDGKAKGIYNIYTINLDGTGLQRLTNQTRGTDWFPVWRSSPSKNRSSGQSSPAALRVSPTGTPNMSHAGNSHTSGTMTPQRSTLKRQPAS